MAKHLEANTMRHAHPFWRGSALALTLMLIMFFTGTPTLMEDLSPTSPERPALAFAGMAIAGAFIAAFPQRMRRLHAPRSGTDWKKCAAAFAAGIALAVSFSAAQSDDLRVLCGAMQGGLGALTFAGCAWIAACVTARLLERRRAE